MRIVFIGPPGAGKGTQSKRLQEYLGVPHISSGDMLRQEILEGTSAGQRSQEYVTAGKLVPDAIILDMMGKRLDQVDCAKGCLFDGFPRTLGQAQALDGLLKRRGQRLDGVLELKVDPDELDRRRAERGRDDDRPAVARERHEQFLRQTQPLDEYYRKQGLLHAIDGTGTADEVFERIMRALAEIAAQNRH